VNPLLSGLLVGIAFGAILFAGGLADPRRIIDMLRLKDLWLLKLLVTALGVGIVGVAVLSALGAAHTSIKTLHVVAIAAGGVLFGLGFALTGYCPGTALAGAASNQRDAFFVIAGGLAGTALFAALYTALRPRLIDPLSFGKPTLFEWLGVPALALALPLGVGIGWLVLRWWRAGRTGHGTPPPVHPRFEPRPAGESRGS
jgi:uncharacterized membrane protein YedE/YeeE